jgi:hypothetical protein
MLARQSNGEKTPGKLKNERQLNITKTKYLKIKVRFELDSSE